MKDIMIQWELIVMPEMVNMFKRQGVEVEGYVKICDQEDYERKMAEYQQSREQQKQKEIEDYQQEQEQTQTQEQIEQTDDEQINDNINADDDQ